MSSVVGIEKLFHRSKDRIRDLGEVFTPESYVEEMLNLLAKGQTEIWADESVSFFEPCSGHGNIVVSIYRRRLEALHKCSLLEKYKKRPNEAPFYAVANALNTLWAIDIDAENVKNCRSRVLEETLEFIKAKLNVKDETQLLSKKKIFFAHILCAIKWHIDENETLSALSRPEMAKANAEKTKAGAKWFSRNGHVPLDFNLSWVDFYRASERANMTPMDYERSLRFINGIISAKTKGFDDFDFAKDVLLKDNRKVSRSMKIGA